MTTLSSEGEEHLSHLSLLELLEEVSEPLREFGIDIVFEKGETTGKEPVFPRNPGILYGLGNLLENAVDFARSKVIIQYKWNEKYVALTIIDDGHGYDRSCHTYATANYPAPYWIAMQQCRLVLPQYVNVSEKPW